MSDMLEDEVKNMDLKSVNDETDSKPLEDETDAKPLTDLIWGQKPKLATMPVHLDSDVYNMKHKERGTAIIFNNKVHIGNQIKCKNSANY